MKSATVIIPTIDGYTLGEAVDSVLHQTHKNVIAHVVYDGPSESCYWDEDERYRLTQLGEKTGKVGDQMYWGHRIFAASAHLTNSDYVLFLDDDNWYEEKHVESLIELCERETLHFAFSRRKIMAKGGDFLCMDHCESIGNTPVWNDPARGYHVDTSAYCFNRQFLIQASSYWHGGYAQDRKFFAQMRLAPGIKYGTTGRYTLNYRLGSTQTSAAPDFFTIGNDRMPNGIDGAWTNTKGFLNG